MAAASITSSRGFFIDDRHGFGLVPGADFFNHKCALVVESHGAGGQEEAEEVDDEADEADDPADEADGSEGGEEDEGMDAESRAAAIEEASRLGLPNLQMEVQMHNLEHEIASESEEEEESESEAEGVGRVADEGVVGRPPRHLLMVSCCALPARKEAFYTYGELSDARLLALGGFALGANALNAAVLPWSTLQAACKALLGPAAYATRERALRQCPHWGDLLTRARDHGFEFDCKLRPSADLRLLLWLLTASHPPAWMFGGSPAQVEAAIDAFLASELAEQLQVAAVNLLQRAITSHTASYALAPSDAPKPTVRVEAAVEEEARLVAWRRQRAEALVFGQLDLWRRVGEWLRELHRGATPGAVNGASRERRRVAEASDALDGKAALPAAEATGAERNGHRRRPPPVQASGTAGSCADGGGGKRRRNR